MLSDFKMVGLLLTGRLGRHTLAPK